MRGHYTRTAVQSNSGKAEPYAIVDVFIQSSGARAPLYNALSGGAILPNPLTTGSTGKIDFWVDVGYYRVEVRPAGGGAPIGVFQYEPVVSPTGDLPSFGNLADLDYSDAFFEDDGRLYLGGPDCWFQLSEVSGAQSSYVNDVIVDGVEENPSNVRDALDLGNMATLDFSAAFQQDTGVLYMTGEDCWFQLSEISGAQASYVNDVILDGIEDNPHAVRDALELAPISVLELSDAFYSDSGELFLGGSDCWFQLSEAASSQDEYVNECVIFGVEYDPDSVLEALGLQNDVLSFSTPFSNGDKIGTMYFRLSRFGKLRVLEVVLTFTLLEGDEGDWNLMAGASAYLLPVDDRPVSLTPSPSTYSGVSGVVFGHSSIEMPGQFSVDVGGTIYINSFGSVAGTNYSLNTSWCVA